MIFKVFAIANCENYIISYYFFWLISTLHNCCKYSRMYSVK